MRARGPSLIVRHSKSLTHRRATLLGRRHRGATTAQEQWHIIMSLPLRALIEAAAQTISA